MIQVEGLSVTFGGNVQALSGIGFTVEDGEFVCVLGKSGAGKSTLIRCLNGLQRPSAGIVTVNGETVTEKSGQDLRRIRADIGMIFQHFQLVPRLTVAMNVYLGMAGKRPWWKTMMGLQTDFEKARIDTALREVEIGDFAHRRVEELSGGQKQRVAVARALVQEPFLLLGDEPVASLDPGTSERLFQKLKDLHDNRGITMFINVHDVTLAKRFATRILALKDGALIFDGPPEAFDEEAYRETYATTT